MSESERWRAVGKRMDECRESEQRKRLDVGGFFDAPKSSWRWITPAAFGVACLSLAAVLVATGPRSAAFADGFACAVMLTWGASGFVMAAKAWRAGR